MATFRKATKQQAKLRMALIGPSGSGKTYTALKIATHLGNRVAVIDTERGSASKYAEKFEFDVLELDSFHPQRYIEGIQAAETEGYDVLIIDSLSHAWAGKDGALELVDKAAKRMQSSNTFAAWRDVTPLHNALVDAMLQSRLHLIATMRAKTEYIVEKDERTGKSVPRKVGLAPIQRDGLEYEFDVVADMDLDNTLIVSKSRCEALNGAVIPKPGEEVADILKAWLTDGVPVQDVPQPQPARAANGASKGDDESTGTSQNLRHRPSTADEAMEKAEKIRSSLKQTGNLTSKQIKRFYAIVRNSGAGDEVTKLVVEKVAPQVMRDGKINWEAVDRNTYDRLCTLFESGGWQSEMERIEDEQNNDMYDDLDLDKLNEFLNGNELA